MKITKSKTSDFRSLSKFYLLLTFFVFCTQLVHAQSKGSSKDSLIVGVAGGEPFVFNDGEKGIAVEIWDEIAKEKEWNYKYSPYNNVDKALDALTNGDIDVLVGPISITAKRLETMRFSQPYYNSSISIMSREENKSFWQILKPLFSFKLLFAVGIFLIILAIVGSLFWLAERKKSPEQFPKDPIKGIGNGMWLAIVTMSTTGYGDKAPITLLGRILAGSWMIISIIFATSMVAGIASTLTLSSLVTTTISNIEQLQGRKVVTITGLPSEELLENFKVKTTGVGNLNDAIEQLESKSVDALVYDRPQLLYYLKNHKNKDLYISKAEYYKQGYGFAFSINSPLISEVNRTLLELAESQQIEKIVLEYIKKDE